MVVDGSTLISPSFYLAFRGAVSVTNYCGPRGKTYYNPTIAVPLEGLSTLSLVSNGWDNVAIQGGPPETAMYDPEACRTYGVDSGSIVEVSWSTNDGWSSTVSVSYHMGAPYNPILLPPKEVTALDPEWEACTSWDYYGDYVGDDFFGMYDPPRALTPAYAMVDPSTISPSSTPQQTYPPPSPVGTMAPPDPKPTIPAGTAATPNPAEVIPPEPESSGAGLAGFVIGPFLEDPTGTAIVIGSPVATKILASPDPHGSLDTNFDESVDSDTKAIWKINPLLLTLPSSGDPARSESPYLMVGETPYYLVPPKTITSSNVRVIWPNPLGDSQPIWIGSSIFTATPGHLYVNGDKTLSRGGPPISIDEIAYSFDPAVTLSPDIVDALSKISADKNPAVTLGGNRYPANSASQYRVNGQTLVPGGPAITVNGVMYSLPSPGSMLMSAGKMIPLNPQRSAPPEALAMLSSMGLVGSQNLNIFVVDGIPITSSPDKFIIGSTTLAPGSPPVTISGHVFTETKGGTLMVDGRPIKLPTGTLSNTFVVDGITMTGDSHLLAVGNTILTPGSPPLRLSGHTLSLATGGALIVDGSTDPLPSLISPATFVVDGCTLTGSPTSLNVDGKTLLPGSPAIQMDSHTFSLGFGGAFIVDGRTTMLGPGLPSSSPASHAINSDDPTSVQNFSSFNGTNPLVFTGMAKRHEAAEYLVFMLGLAGLVSNV